MKNYMPIFAIVAAVPVAAATQTPSTPREPAAQQAVGTTGALAAEAVEIDEIVDDPDDYYGKKVTIRGSVSDVLGEQMFRVREHGVIDIDDTLLVMHPKRAKNSGAWVSDASNVRVTGTVRKFNRADLEREYGFSFGDWGITDDGWFDDHDAKPVLVIDSVEVK